MQKIENVNMLAPNTFRFVLHGLEEVTYFLQQVNLPAVSIGTVSVTTPTQRDYDNPDNKVQFEDLNMTFVVDEDLRNWEIIKNWLTRDLVNITDYPKNAINEELFKDATLYTLSNSSNPNVRIKFRRIFPTSISGLDFNTSTGPDTPMTASVTFKYLDFVFDR
jgi:hypothetical protein